MNIKCQGPCLLHCYYKSSILLLLIGFIIGLCVSNVYYLNWNDEHKNK